MRNMLMLTLLLAVGVGQPALATTYVSTGAGTVAMTYDADPNGVYPDSTGYGDFTNIQSDFTAGLDYPTPEQGAFEWYVDPLLDLSGYMLGQIPVTATIGPDGLLLTVNGQPVVEVSWEDLGYVYTPGLGVFLTEMPTPESFFPADPDRILGLYDYDHEPDGESDLLFDVTGGGGSYHLDGGIYRSATWMGLQGTGLPEAFADYLDAVLPGLPPELLDQIRAIDLAPLAVLELLIGAAGGPIPGSDVEMAGEFEITVRAHRAPSPAVETSWGSVKSLFR